MKRNLVERGYTHKQHKETCSSVPRGLLPLERIKLSAETECVEAAQVPGVFITVVFLRTVLDIHPKLFDLHMYIPNKSTLSCT